MSDPVRWREPGGEAPSGAPALLEAARRTKPLTDAQRARSEKRVARIAALPLAVGLLASLKSVAAAAALGAGSAVVLIGAITIVEARLDDAPAPVAPAVPSTPAVPRIPSTPAAAPIEAPSSTPVPAEPPSTVFKASPPLPPPTSEAPFEAPAPGDTATGQVSPPASAGVTATAPVDESITREAALLEEARARLASSPADALTRLSQHAQLFPKGKLGLEREYLTIHALRRLGRGAEAKARGEALLARFKGTLYEARVRQMLGGAP